MNATNGRLWFGGFLLVAVSLAAHQITAGADQPAIKQQSSRVDYARTYVQLAKLNLQNAQLINQRNANTVPNAQLAVLQEQVALAEEWVREAEDAAAGKPHNAAVVLSEIMLKAAEADFASTQRINQIAPLSRGALEKARLKLELAKLRVATAKQIDANSPLAILQFQVERLRENLSELATQQVRTVDLD